MASRTTRAKTKAKAKAKAKSGGTRKATRPARPAERAITARRGSGGRKVPAVSPNRGMPIEEWIARGADGWRADVIRRMIAVVRDAAPEAVASIKWNQPMFEQNGPFAFIMPAKAHVSFGFWRGAEVVDPKGLLERGDRMGHFKLTAPISSTRRR